MTAEIFILITDDSIRYPQENDPAYAKVMGASSVGVRVTDEGHELSAGQRAYVATSQKDLEKALNRGSVIRLDSPNTGSGNAKRKANHPKARKVSADGAVRRDSERSADRISAEETTTSNELKKKND